MKLLLTILLITTLTLSLNASTAQEEMAKMKAEFESYKQKQDNDFTDYKENLDKEFSAYKKELEKYWDEPKLSTKKEWVSYSEDKKSRLDVDFENDKIVIETVAKNEQEAKQALEKRLAYAVSKNTEEVIESDPLQQRIQKISKPLEKKSLTQDTKPILSTVIFNKEPNVSELKKYTNTIVTSTPIKVQKSKFDHENVYTMTIALPSDTRLKRSKIYAPDVMKNADRFELPIPLIFAIMHTESDFNPMATSHIPAFGLMQIVPTSAGKDIYQFLYNKKGMPSATYLYNGKNNIEMGSTYLHILYYRYLKEIKNPESRLYCAIAAYNTGAGNIAWAFTRTYSMPKAAPKINAMTPNEVYAHLMRDLRFDEPKHYLKNVKKRMSAYKKAYKL
jgi:membrane-bound lytic murein transglycosylase C